LVNQMTAERQQPGLPRMICERNSSGGSGAAKTQRSLSVTGETGRLFVSFVLKGVPMNQARLQTGLVVTAICILLFTKMDLGQTVPDAAKTPSFEVASIKQNMNPNPAWRLNFTPDGVSARDVTLLWALSEAYGVRDLSLTSGGPAWIDEKRFDIEAKYDVSLYPNLTRQQRMEMLQQLLADRFKLVVHHEAKDFPLYALVVVRSGSKLVETKPEDIQQSRMGGPVCHVTGVSRSSLKLVGCTSGDLANILYGAARSDLGRRVEDRTGLKGTYTVDLHWGPIAAASPLPDASNPSDAGGPSIFTAVKEQLGLELKPINGPLDTIVIDHVEMPSEN
jgi:uncharacterized protein (TIGR03435 family)